MTRSLEATAFPQMRRDGWDRTTALSPERSPRPRSCSSLGPGSAFPLLQKLGTEPPLGGANHTPVTGWELSRRLLPSARGLALESPVDHSSLARGFTVLPADTWNRSIVSIFPAEVCSGRPRARRRGRGTQPSYGPSYGSSDGEFHNSGGTRSHEEFVGRTRACLCVRVCAHAWVCRAGLSEHLERRAQGWDLRVTIG